ncbi:acyl-CoA dehydrogenase family protein [Actinomadura mexicana]|uniref:Acyl-CoA dehydrogenase n=1 Tax=Actinomadura mexicana TaxID=134959 RepID=A0A239C359_9ACTN|nr:acyl-CoA dehydrogenase family protein [Actinomadura mexicana]SNS14061.1 Acyl-CoA dehydrogenase [Actinomadura mexicana]
MTDSMLTRDEAELASTARSFLSGFVGNSYLNEQEESEDGHEQARWKQMTGLGWTAVNLPERVGGGDGSLAAAAMVAREIGRAAYASPLLQTMRTGTLLASLGSDERADELMARIAGGSPAAVVASADRTVRARAVGGGAFLLSGSAAVVEWLTAAGTAVVLVPRADSDGWLLATLPPEVVGERGVAVPSVDNERESLLDLDGVGLPAATALRDDVPAADAEYALARANLLRASAMVGGAEEVLAQSTRYAKTRHQFGRPIGAFQAVRHHLARMSIAVDGARLLTDEALTRAEPSAHETAIAGAALFAAARSYVEAVLTGAQVHGGVGTTVEHILHHHFRRAKSMQLRCGKRANRLRELHGALVVRREGGLW